MGDDLARYIRNREVVARQIEGELIIVPIRSGVGDLNYVYTLNQIGSMLWDFMTEGRTLAEMTSKVCEEFEVNANVAQKDVEMFLISLMEEKLIQPLALVSARV